MEYLFFFFFFCLRHVFTIFIFYTGSFQVPPKKYHLHLKCQFPSKIQIWPKSLLYERFEKWLSPCMPITQGWGVGWGGVGGGCKLWILAHILIKNQTFVNMYHYHQLNILCSSSSPCFLKIHSWFTVQETVPVLPIQVWGFKLFFSRIV